MMPGGTRQPGEPIDLVIAIHGILTSRSEPTWPERLETHLTARRSVIVLTDHYDAGPLPRLNWFLGNPERGKAIARLVAHWSREANIRSIHFVAHSNGCDIARRAIRELTGRHGITVATAILISAPLPNTTKRIGLQDAIADGTLERVICYIATNDRVLAPPFRWYSPVSLLGTVLRWPYGNLGRIGLRDARQHLRGQQDDVTATTANRFFHGWGHSDFFPRDRRRRMRAIFQLITRDLRIP